MLYLLSALAAIADDGTCGAWGAPGAPVPIATPALNELSGLAASRRFPGVLWAHADSGGGPVIYALDSGGNDRGAFAVSGADSVDWEDIAAGPCDGEAACTCLYIADIGDNDLSRERYALYRIPEPDPGVSGNTAAAASVAFSYEGGPRDAEALLVHPLTGEVLILSKRSGATELFTFPEAPPALDGGEYLLAPAGTLDLAAFGVEDGLTAGDVSPDGRRIILRSDEALLEYALPEGASLVEALLGGTPVAIEAPEGVQGEAATYTEDGRAIALGDEGSPAALRWVECVDFRALDASDPLLDCELPPAEGGCGGCGGGGGGGLGPLLGLIAALSRCRWGGCNRSHSRSPTYPQPLQRSKYL